METREWRGAADRSKWPAGPWDAEPDKRQWPDPATDLPCLIVRHTALGHLCGYVGVPLGHPLHGAGGDELDVHGGVTFAGRCQPHPTGGEGEAICHVAGPGEPDDVWWFGFDCAHHLDESPSDVMLRVRFRLPELLANGERIGTYRDVPYVTAECAKLATQLAAVKA